MKFSASELFSIAFAAIFVQNLVMVRMLTSNVFFKALKSPVSGIKFGLMVTISTTVISALAWLLDRFVLKTYSLDWLIPFSFIFLIVLFELAADLVMKKFASSVRRSLGGMLPASAFNCAVLGLLFINVQNSTTGILETVLYGFFAGLGFVLALFVAANAMERVEYSTPARAFRGLPIAFVTASLISLAFMGFWNFKIPF